MIEKAVRILIVDDHPVVRAGLKAILTAQPDMDVIAEAENGVEAIRLFDAHHPNLVLMDLRMKGMNGIETTRALSQKLPKPSILILTNYHGDEEIFHALHAGARGYLLKEAAAEELVDAVRSVYRGRRYLPREIAEQLAERLARTELSTREMDVLALIVKGKSNKEIASDLKITDSTVKGHINNLLNKMGVADRTEAAVVAIQRGLIPID